VTKFGIRGIVLCQWLLSIILFWRLWKLLTLHRAVLIVGSLLVVIPTAIVAIVSTVSGFWLWCLDKRGWYSSNLLGSFLFLVGIGIFIWNETGLPQELEKSGGAGALGLIMLACLIFSIVGLLLINLPKTRRTLGVTASTAQG
jgi:hypothetical protein